MSNQTEMNEFIAILVREFPDKPLTDLTDAAYALRRYATGMHTISERQCSEEMSEAETSRLDRRDESLTQRAKAIAERIGATYIDGSGDPRGCPFLLGVPSGHTNEFGGRGIYVPYTQTLRWQ